MARHPGVRKPCMGPWESSRKFTTWYFSFNPISLFDLKAHFFAPTRSFRTLSRAGAVKIGRHSDISSCTGYARPHLDSSEHGSTLVVVGMTMSRGARLWRTNHRAATLYSVGRNDPDHDAVLRIGSEAPRRRAHSAQRHESHGFRGTPPPRTVIGDPSPWCGSRRSCQAIGDVHSIARVHYAARMATPSGTTPSRTSRHNAIRSLRASATIMVLRAFGACSVRRRYHCARALFFWNSRNRHAS